MMGTTLPARRDASARGFTLVELLVVMAIVVILLGLVVPAVRSFSESGNLARSGQMLADQINLARQLASARNCTVEVRLCKSDNGAAGYDVIQLWTTRANPAVGAGAGAASVVVALDKAQSLPGGMAVSENTKLSQLLAALPAPAPMTAPGLYQGRTSVAFQIRPQGAVMPVYAEVSVSPSATGSPPPSSSRMAFVYLTVVPRRFAGTALPQPLSANYLTVQVNPFTGTALIYQP